MTYKDLEPMLIDMMENGTAMNLMSLINTIKQCDDVKSIVTDEGWYITKESIVTLRSRGCAYKPGYLDVKFANDNYFEIYNNTKFSVVFKEKRTRDSIDIWFTKTDLISVKEKFNKNNQPIKARDLLIDWDKDEIYLIRVNGHKVEIRSILSDSELKV